MERISGQKAKGQGHWEIVVREYFLENTWINLHQTITN